jgi:hypothetical protein
VILALVAFDKHKPLISLEPDLQLPLIYTGQDPIFRTIYGRVCEVLIPEVPWHFRGRLVEGEAGARL